MANPITSAWRALRRVVHPLELALLTGIAIFLVGLWLWLPEPMALLAIGGVVIALSIIAIVASAENGR